MSVEDSLCDRCLTLVENDHNGKVYGVFGLHFPSETLCERCAIKLARFINTSEE